MSVAGKKLSDYPHLFSEWYAERNIALNPFEVAAGSNKKIWWCGMVKVCVDLRIKQSRKFPRKK